MTGGLDDAWKGLGALPHHRLEKQFADDRNRLELLTARLELPDETGILFDWSKTHLDPAHLAAFERLAETAGFAARREALFTGGVVNPTEGRAAEHTAQRGLGSEASVEEASALHMRMRGLVAAPDGSRLVSGEWRGHATDAERIGREGGAELRARADFLPG